MHLYKFGVRKLISLSLALLGALLSLTGTAQDVSFKTEYIGNSGYYFLPSGDKPREKIDDGKGSAMVYQGKAAIPLSMKVNNDGRPTAWGIGLEGTYTSLHNENFTEEMVSEIVNFQIGMYHVRPLNAKWSMRASAGVGVFTASTDISKIRFRNVLGSVGVIFIRHLKPNLSVGGGLAINSALGYPMLFPAFYVNWKHDGKFNVKAELIDGLDISTSYEFNDYFKLALALEMNGQMALLKKDGEDMIFSHQYIVAGFRPEIQVGKSGLSVSPMIGLNLYRPASYTERTLKGMFASDNDYYFSVSPYAALGLKMKF
jgi:hypothetical protein